MLGRKGWLLSLERLLTSQYRAWIVGRLGVGIGGTVIAITYLAGPKGPGRKLRVTSKSICMNGLPGSGVEVGEHPPHRWQWKLSTAPVPEPAVMVTNSFALPEPKQQQDNIKCKCWGWIFTSLPTVEKILTKGFRICLKNPHSLISWIRQHFSNTMLIREKAKNIIFF